MKLEDYISPRRVGGGIRYDLLVEAIIDVDADGNLAGVEIIDTKCPGPPGPKLIKGE